MNFFLKWLLLFTFISEDPFSDISQYISSWYVVLQLEACKLLKQAIKKVKLLLLLNRMN